MSRPDNPFLDPAIPTRMLEDETVLFAALASDGTVTWVGDGTRLLLDREPEELLHHNALEFIHPEDHDVIVETMAEGARGSVDRVRVPLRVSHGDGSWVTLEFGGTDMRDADGDGPFLIWGSPHDATSRLIEFMDLLLAGATLDDLLASVVRWQGATMPNTASAVYVRQSDGLYRPAATSRALPDGLRFEFDPAVGPSGPWIDAARGASGVPWQQASELPTDVAALSVDAGFGSVGAVAAGAEGERAPAVLVVWRRGEGPALATQRRQLHTTAQVIRLGLEWVSARQDLVAAATTDLLTGLANRSQLEARVRADGSRLAAVLFCDLDDFKVVNDRHGHLVGDRILREAARRMSHAIRGDDLLVRVGGDEFAVWCPALRSGADAEAVAGRLVAAMADPVEIDGHPHVVGCSIGVAVVRAEDPIAGDVDRILATADRALYVAKRTGKGRYAVDRGGERQLPFDG